MIGTASLLLEMAFPLVVTLMGVAMIVMVCRTRPFQWGGVAGLLLILAFAALVDVRFFHQVQARRSLQALRAEEVRRIQIGDHRITDPKDVAAVVDALHAIEWFSANRGGMGPPQWFILSLASGDRHLLKVARYQRGEGAILEFRRGTKLGAFRDGYAYSRTLPAVLESLGIRLDEKKAPQEAASPTHRGPGTPSPAPATSHSKLSGSRPWGLP